MEYNRREVIELKFQAQKQSSGQLHFFRAEIGLVKKKNIKPQTTVMQNQIISGTKWFSDWKGEGSDAVFLSLISACPSYLASCLSSILIFVVWLLKIQWLYQVFNVRVLLPFNYWSCWGCAGQSCGSSDHGLLQDLLRMVPKRSPVQDRAEQTDCQVSCLLQWEEVSWSAVTESVLTFPYLPVPVWRAFIFHSLYKVVSYYFLQIINFVAGFTTFASFHITPCPG